MAALNFDDGVTQVLHPSPFSRMRLKSDPCTSTP